MLGYTFLASSLSFMVVILDLFYTVMSDSLSSNMLDSIIVAIKFLLLIALLVFIRGGIPRYRFDHLTKMG
jgi:NADH:ubiquinone oxidoreductase subunit H